MSITKQLEQRMSVLRVEGRSKAANFAALLIWKGFVFATDERPPGTEVTFHVDCLPFQRADIESLREQAIATPSPASLCEREDCPEKRTGDAVNSQAGLIETLRNVTAALDTLNVHFHGQMPPADRAARAALVVEADVLLKQYGIDFTALCNCEEPGAANCGLPGVLAEVEHGRIIGEVERCESCIRFASDEDARDALRVFLLYRAELLPADVKAIQRLELSEVTFECWHEKVLTLEGVCLAVKEQAIENN
jgi:hypothetical protein